MQEYPWKHHRRFNAYPQYFERTFGERIQKVTIDAGFSCPNRDGKVARGGCTYCNNDAFNPSYNNPSKSVKQQIEEGIEFHANRYRRASKYLAYFQAYSNTYKPLEELKRIYAPALEQDNIQGIVIGTRTDCMDEEKLKYFADIAKTHYVILEYGIESCYDKTLELINRGHDFQSAVDMIELTHFFGLKVGAHMIFGVYYAVQTEGAFLILPIDGFKAMGDKSAKIVIMEFTDFECPFCRKFHSETLPLIQAEYIDTGKVRWITRAFPLPFHLAALPAAKSLYCVGKFGTDKQYWDFYNKLFLSDKINPSTPFEIAEQIGLNREKIAQCVSSSSAQDFIKKENSNATIYGVSGTPTFFIGLDNGADSIKAVKLVGAQPIGKFREKIDSLLKSSK